MREFTNGINFTAIDRINSVTAESLAEKAGQTITIVGVAFARDEREGKMVDAGYVKTSDGMYYNTISSTALQGLDGILELLETPDYNSTGVAVEILERKSSNNRKYILLKLVTPDTANTSGH